MKLVDGIPVWGDPVDSGALEQIKRCAETAEHVALMADHHLGYSVPIGGVLAYREAVAVSGVGFDIACGNLAVRTDALASDVKRDIAKIMDEVASRISFGMGLTNNMRVDHELFDDYAWKITPCSGLKEMAHAQLGTVGSGNHYVDIFEDEAGRIWIGVHFGSRGFGHKVATYFLKQGGAIDALHAPPLVLPTDTPLGNAYLQAMTLAGRYAYVGRDWVCAEVARILGAQILEEVHNHHNFAWRETHLGEEYWVVRKGATPAFPGQKGFVGGSMGDDSVILEGVDPETHLDTRRQQELSMYSTVHGAGRVMSRTQARGKVNRKTGEVVTQGQVSKTMMHEWISEKGVTLRGADTDEAPHCYKRLPEVLQHHSEGIRVLHTLRPLGVAMAGAEVYDPFRD